MREIPSAGATLTRKSWWISDLKRERRRDVLLNLHVAAARALGGVEDAFLGRPGVPPPYIIGVAGSVAVGKSSFARLLRVLLSRWPDHPKVEI